MELLPLILVVGGVILLVALVGRLGLGRLPGDMSASRGNVKLYAPLGTSILVSIVLTLLLNAAFCGVQR